MNRLLAVHITTNMHTTTFSTRNGKPRAFPYCRWSSDLQTDGSSRERQLKAINDYCEQEKLEPQPPTIDEAKSARFGDHRKKGELGKLLEILRAGDWLLLEDNDRWSREDTLTAMSAMKEVVFRGVTMVFMNTRMKVTKENFYESGIFLTNIIKQFMANDANETKAKRVNGGWKKLKNGAAAAKRIIMTEATPAWWRADKEKNEFFPVEPHITTLRRIFNDYSEGKGIRTIVAELNMQKVPSYGRGKQNSGKWSSTHLRRLLESRNVLGEYQPHKYIRDESLNTKTRKRRVTDGPPVPNYYPEVIKPALFHYVQGKLAENGHASGPKDRVTNLFTGFIKCANCQGPLHIKRSPAEGGKYRYISLICANGKDKSKDCGHKTIQYSWVERAVLTILWSKIVPLMKSRDTSRDELMANEGELNHTEKLIAEYEEAMVSENARPQTVVNALSKLEVKRDELKRSIDGLSARIERNPLAGWQPVPNTKENRLRLQMILKDEIDAISIDIPNVKGVLKVREPDCQFEIGWDRFQGDVKRSYGSICFKISGERHQYLDELFVWQSDKFDVRFEIKEAA